MAPSGPTTVILPVNLGAASKYEEDIFPLAYHKVDDPISKGSLLLSATLDEMIKIAEMGIDLSTDESFHFSTRVQYETLAAKEAKLQSRPQSFNPFTMFRYYRATRMFHAASKALFLETKRTSERMQRQEKFMRAVPSKELHSVNDKAPQDATIEGIAVTLPGELNDDARRTILAATNAIALRASASDDSSPFTDNPQTPQMSDADSVVTLAETASVLSEDVLGYYPQVEPGSPGSPSYNFYFYNSLLTAGTNVHDVTVTHGGSENKGSIVTRQELPS